MNRPGQLCVGDRLEYDDCWCTVEALARGLVYLRSDDGVLYTVTPTAIVAALVSATVKEPPLVPRRGSMEAISGLEGVSDDVKREARERLAHILEVETGYRAGDAALAEVGEPRPAYRSDETLKSRIRAKADELEVSFNTVRNWLDAYRDYGVFGLVDRRKARIVNPLVGADPRLVDAIKAVAAAETNDSTGSLQRLRRRVQRYLDDKYGAGEVAVPPKSTFNRYAHMLVDAHYTLDAATTRRTAAASPDRSFGSFVATRPGEVVVFDSTRLDVLAWDPDTNETTAVELTVAMDLCSRSLLAWRLTPAETNRADVALLLADAITPEEMRPGWPDAVRFKALGLPVDQLTTIDERLEAAAARPVILPETVLIDHGKVFMSDAFTDACQRLGISIQLARVRQGSDKPVERVFGTIRTQFSEHVAGYKGPNVSQRGADVEGCSRRLLGGDEVLQAVDLRGERARQRGPLIVADLLVVSLERYRGGSDAEERSAKVVGALLRRRRSSALLGPRRRQLDERVEQPRPLLRERHVQTLHRTDERGGDTGEPEHLARQHPARIASDRHRQAEARLGEAEQEHAEPLPCRALG